MKKIPLHWPQPTWARRRPLASALATRTQRLRVGVRVTGNTYRHPAVLTNMGATVDQIAHGRLEFGVGAGWHEQEHAMYGLPLYAPAERIHRLDEACALIQLRARYGCMR